MAHDLELEANIRLYDQGPSIPSERAASDTGHHRRASEIMKHSIKVHLRGRVMMMGHETHAWESNSGSLVV
jgi:hypothetical protein